MSDNSRNAAVCRQVCSHSRRTEDASQVFTGSLAVQEGNGLAEMGERGEERMLTSRNSSALQESVQACEHAADASQAACLLLCCHLHSTPIDRPA